MTVLGWQSCGHTGPVHEGDTLVSELTIGRAEPLAEGSALELRSRVFAVRAGTADIEVLAWRFTVLMA